MKVKAYWLHYLLRRAAAQVQTLAPFAHFCDLFTYTASVIHITWISRDRISNSVKILVLLKCNNIGGIAGRGKQMQYNEGVSEINEGINIGCKNYTVTSNLIMH